MYIYNHFMETCVVVSGDSRLEATLMSDLNMKFGFSRSDICIWFCRGYGKTYVYLENPHQKKKTGNLYRRLGGP